MPGPGSPHGIYVFDGSEWRELRREGEAIRPEELGDGVVVVYFDNALCPACRLQDRYWLEVVKRFSGEGRVKFVVVLCDWFSDNCRSSAAAESFKIHRVSASPTIHIYAVKDGRRVYDERLEGVRTDSIISLYINRALEALS